MVKYKVIFDREACIGALACSAIQPELWRNTEDGKVDLINASKREDGKFEVEIDESVFKAHQEAEHSCPVFAIKIEKIDELQDLKKQ